MNSSSCRKTIEMPEAFDDATSSQLVYSAPEGWLCVKDMAKEIGYAPGQTAQIIRQLEDDGILKGIKIESGDKPNQKRKLYYDSKALKKAWFKKPPKGWGNSLDVSKAVGKAWCYTRTVLSSLIKLGLIERRKYHEQVTGTNFQNYFYNIKEVEKMWDRKVD